MATKAPAKKTRVTKKQVIAHRTRAVKDHSPTWDNSEAMDTSQFLRHFHTAMEYYRLEFSGKDLKPAIIKWMTSVECTKEDIAAFKKTRDQRCGVTMGAIASCLLRGMPDVRADFNDGRSTSAWLRAAIVKIVEDGKYDIDEEEEAAKAESNKKDIHTPSIQERVRDAAFGMTEEIEDAIEGFQTEPEAFDPKAFKVLNLLKGKGVKAAHARIIKDFYARDLSELEELASGKADEQLREGYSHLSKKQVKNLIAFYQEIASACDMLTQDIGSKELWIFNTKSRKIGRYVAEEYKELGVKGTTITGFDANLSVQKTVRKPEEKLKEFKAAGKVQLRKFLDEINATDTKMNGRINEETILLKVQS